MTAPVSFTQANLGWSAWLPIVELERATPAQIAVLDASNPTARGSDYYRVLLHDAPALEWRSKLYHAVMYAPQGLSRSEREFAAVVESVLNGCPYCASVHSRLFSQLTKDPELIERVFKAGARADLPERLKAIAEYAEALAQTPPRPTRAQIARLRALGLDDLDLLDLTHAVAMFAWANRLMQTLGAPTAPVI
jgi:uncharacterized peroxidase-related enzyme